MSSWACKAQGAEATPNDLQDAKYCEATYRLIQGYFDCAALGDQKFQGVAEPIAVYRVLHESGALSRLEIAGAHGLTPLIGRESEVTLLLERWGQVKDGQGQVVLLSGEAGIGKSRLVQVLKEHVANEPHIRWECRSSPYFTNSALYPVVSLDSVDDQVINRQQGLIPQACFGNQTGPDKTVILTHVASQEHLDTTAQELTGDWRGYTQPNPTTSVNQPTGPAPTQDLGVAQFATPILEGFVTVSAKLPYHQNFVVFPEKLQPGSYVQFNYPGGVLPPYRLARSSTS